MSKFIFDSLQGTVLAGWLFFMEFVKKYRAIIFIGSVMVVGLSACGVETKIGDTPSDAPTFLNDFFILGNLPAAGNVEQIGLPVPVPPSFVGAGFSLSWDVESSDPYYVTVHISTDSNTSFDTGDQVFLELQCGSDNTAYDCGFIVDRGCSIAYEPEFDTNSVFVADHYYLRCPGGLATINEVEITDRLTTAGFPGTSVTNYIVFKVCNAATSSCLRDLAEINILDLAP